MAESSLSRITVYLIDDHPVVREGFARVIADEPDMDVVGQAGTAEEALEEVGRRKPDVVLVDLNMPDRDGADLVRALRAELPAAKLLVLSGYDDAFRITEALLAGAQGYLVKTSRLEEVVDGVRQVLVGGAPLSPGIADAVVRAMQRPDGLEGTGGIETLTPRELQVLRLLAAGVSTVETANRLTISQKTVETHRMRVYAKLDCHSAVELTRIAVQSGIMEA